ncbi:MAG: Tfp pilus assembly protein FimT/FimU [Puniceicoccaceae bacterium]
MDPLRRTPRSAFTLIELLVVLAVIAVFVGAFATALGPGNPTVAVQGAQSQLASLLTQARGVAVLRGAETRLIVHADPDNPDRFLRFAGIVYDANEDPSGDPEWEAATDGGSLPNGVYFVPPSGSLLSNVSYDDDWDERVRSRFSGADTDRLQYISNDPEDYFYLTFNERGLVEDAESPVLAVANARPEPDENWRLVFENSGAARGAIVRLYGSFVLLNESDAFPTP